MLISKLDARYLTSPDGTVIYADAIGNPSKPHIVFVHGLSLSGAVFDNVFTDTRYHSEFYMVSTVPRYIFLQAVILFLQVRYDMRGHGRSGKPEADEGYLSQRYAEDYQAVSQAFHLKRPVFVGW